MTRFGFGPRRIVFSLRQAASTAAAALSASATRAPATPVSALIATPVTTAISAAVSTTIAATVSPTVSLETGGALHGTRWRRERRRGHYIHGHCCAICRGSGRWLRRCLNGRRLHRQNGSAVELQDLLFHRRDNLVVLVVVFEEIRNVEKGVPAEADIDECRLHAWQHARHSTFMDGTR